MKYECQGCFQPIELVNGKWLDGLSSPEYCGYFGGPHVPQNVFALDADGYPIPPKSVVL